MMSCRTGWRYPALSSTSFGRFRVAKRIQNQHISRLARALHHYVLEAHLSWREEASFLPAFDEEEGLAVRRGCLAGVSEKEHCMPRETQKLQGSVPEQRVFLCTYVPWIGTTVSTISHWPACPISGRSTRADDVVNEREPKADMSHPTAIQYRFGSVSLRRMHIHTPLMTYVARCCRHAGVWGSRAVS